MNRPIIQGAAHFRAVILGAAAFVAGLSCLVVSPAPAAPGAGGGGSSPEPRALDTGGPVDPTVAQRNVPATLGISGRVVDSAGAALSGFAVKLFTNGVSTQGAVTGPDGTFRIDSNVMLGPDVTADLWVQSPDLDKYLDTNVILVAGKAAEELGLIPDCTERATLFGNSMDLQIRMLSPREQKQAVEDAGCLAGS